MHVMVNDPFSDLPFFGSEESVWSKITNPFLDSPKKTQPKSGFYQVKLAEESTWLTTYVQHTFLQV